MSLLSVQHITKRFGRLVAVSDVSFELEEGEILGLIGPNGAGKSTIFNMIAGVCKPSEGTISLEGRRIDGCSPYEICHKGISRTFQLVKPFLSETVFENVLMAAAFSGRLKSDHCSSYAEQAILLASLEQSRDSLVSSLPFLQRRKVELARAIATNPRLVLLDEPMAGLNPVEVGEFLDIIKKINVRGITVLLIEHVIHAIVRLSTRIIVLDHGEKIAEGSPHEVSTNSKVVEAYLGR